MHLIQYIKKNYTQEMQNNIEFLLQKIKRILLEMNMFTNEGVYVTK